MHAANVPAGRAQLRSDLIESARMEKEANLTPETPPKAERKIVWAQNSLAYRLLTGQVDGFGVGFGNIVPGSGFAIGPQYKRTDLLERPAHAQVEARAAINESYLGRLDLSLPHLFDDRAFLDFSTRAPEYLRDALLRPRAGFAEDRAQQLPAGRHQCGSPPRLSAVPRVSGRR